MMRSKHHLTMLEFNDDDTVKAEKIARNLGYTEFAYTSTSALIGLFVMVSREQYKQGKPKGCIIKTEELGFLFVADGEDFYKGYQWDEVV